MNLAVKLKMILKLFSILFNLAVFASSGQMIQDYKSQLIWMPSGIPENIYNDFKEELAVVQERYDSKISLSESKQRECHSAYKKIFNKKEINWSIYFGYGDGYDVSYTTDFAERYLFEKELTTTCQKGIQFCEFQVVDIVKGIYQKQIITKDNTQLIIHLRLYNSSLTNNISDNQKKFHHEQIKKSKNIEKSFLRSLNTDDIVFYSGHARHGTGPGFRPLVAYSKDWWISALFRPMNLNMMNTLKSEENQYVTLNKKNPNMIGFFMCDAEAHYGEDLVKNTSPDSAFILTRETMSTADNMRLLYAAANALVSETCEDEFQHQMNQSITKIFYNAQKGAPTQFDSKLPKVFNFFHLDKVKSRNDLRMLLEDKYETSLNVQVDEDGVAKLLTDNDEESSGEDGSEEDNGE